jgi:putative glycosyltransferase (exosortase G-associated)
VNTHLLPFLAFWGVWLIIPMLLDGTAAMIALVGGWWVSRKSQRQPPLKDLSYFPLVSILVPVYNGESTLGACLRALRQQTYPHNRMDVVVINNGSTDGTFAVFDAEQQQPFAGRLSWFTISDKGKSWALNAGIHLAHGSLIINLDADTVLHPDAVLNMVRAFETDPSLASATGAISVLEPANPTPGLIQTILAECEFIEYLASFKIGRVYQSLNDSLYTLAGAFCAFRRDVLLRTFLYSQETVTEDTDLTLDLHEKTQSEHIACVPEATAFVHPIPSLRALYSQRVRWQRGQLEVAARHEKFMRRGGFFRLRGLSLQRLLLMDHTLSFPRMVWFFFLPALVAFDYPLSLVLTGFAATYVLYAAIEAMWILVTYLVSEPEARLRLRRSWWLFLATPLYRFVVYWFRLAGFLAAQAEPPSWRVTDPVTATRAGLAEIRQRLMGIAESIRQSAIRRWRPTPR